MSLFGQFLRDGPPVILEMKTFWFDSPIGLVALKMGMRGGGWSGVTCLEWIPVSAESFGAPYFFVTCAFHPAELWTSNAILFGWAALLLLQAKKCLTYTALVESKTKSYRDIVGVSTLVNILRTTPVARTAAACNLTFRDIVMLSRTWPFLTRLFSGKLTLLYHFMLRIFETLQCAPTAMLFGAQLNIHL